jgi:Putative prokaryotic signal transducing protein
LKRVKTARHVFEAHHWRNLLAAAGIESVLRNEHIGSAFGELPVDICAPEVWLTDPRQEEKALQLILEASRPMGTAIWPCVCGEAIEPQFFTCWNCGAHRPD